MRVHGGWWLVDESGLWVADCRAALVQTELWGAMDCLIKLDHKMCVAFPQPYRTWLAYGRENFPSRSVREFQLHPGHEMLNPTGHDYFAGTVLSRTSEAGRWNQREAELTRREVIHYMMQPALPFTGPPTGAETLETDLTGLRSERAACQRLVLRGLKMLARNYWLEALHRFASDEFRTFKTAKYREKLKFKMRRVMRKLSQRLELLSMLMPHGGCHECTLPHRESLDEYMPAPPRNPRERGEPGAPGELEDDVPVMVVVAGAAKEAPPRRRIDTSQMQRKMQLLALQRAAAAAGAATSQTRPPRWA